MSFYILKIITRGNVTRYLKDVQIDKTKYAVLTAEMKSTHPELHFAGSESKIHRVVVDKSSFWILEIQWQ